MSFIQSYLDDIEKSLLALSNVARNSGHSVIKGSAREFFMKDFLSRNISPLWSVGSGEIIHSESQVGDKRNQIDAVLYNCQFPSFEYSPGVSAFFVEGVSSLIEVKTKLTKIQLEGAIRKTIRIKKFPRKTTQTFNPHGLIKRPRVYSFVFAFDGCRPKTLVKWISEIHEKLDLRFEGLASMEQKDRFKYDNPSIDGVFILNKGFAFLDSAPFYVDSEKKKEHPNLIWNYGNTNILMFFWIYINEINKILAWNRFSFYDYIPAIDIVISDGKKD